VEDTSLHKKAQAVILYIRLQGEDSINVRRKLGANVKEEKEEEEKTNSRLSEKRLHIID